MLRQQPPDLDRLSSATPTNSQFSPPDSEDPNTTYYPTTTTSGVLPLYASCTARGGRPRLIYVNDNSDNTSNANTIDEYLSIIDHLRSTKFEKDAAGDLHQKKEVVFDTSSSSSSSSSVSSSNECNLKQLQSLPCNNLRTCLACGESRERTTMKLCGECKKAWLCNETCMKTAWPNHRKECAAVHIKVKRHELTDRNDGIANGKSCMGCGKSGSGLKTCGGCRKAWFCTNENCLNSAWAAHRSRCSRTTNE